MTHTHREILVFIDIPLNIVAQWILVKRINIIMAGLKGYKNARR